MNRREMVQEVVGGAARRLGSVLPLLMAPSIVTGILRPHAESTSASVNTGSPAFPSGPAPAPEGASEEPGNTSEVNTCNSHVATS